MYAALGVTTLLYVLISLGVFGTLTVDAGHRLRGDRDRGGRPAALGEAGFVMMAVAALLATASTVNASLYASGGLTATLAEVGQFPPFFGRGSRLGPHAGLLITAAIVLVVANVVDLVAIASVGSACSLMIFLLVGSRATGGAPRHGLSGRDRAGGDRGDGDRARVLRDRHRATPRRRSPRSSRSRCSRWPSTSSGSESAPPRAQTAPPPPAA